MSHDSAEFCLEFGLPLPDPYRKSAQNAVMHELNCTYRVNQVVFHWLCASSMFCTTL